MKNVICELWHKQDREACLAARCLAEQGISQEAYKKQVQRAKEKLRAKIRHRCLAGAALSENIWFAKVKSRELKYGTCSLRFSGGDMQPKAVYITAIEEHKPKTRCGARDFRRWILGFTPAAAPKAEICLVDMISKGLLSKTGALSLLYLGDITDENGLHLGRNII